MTGPAPETPVPATPMPAPTFASTALAVAIALSPLRSTAATVAPSATSRDTSARPIPLPAPRREAPRPGGASTPARRGRADPHLTVERPLGGNALELRLFEKPILDVE